MRQRVRLQQRVAVLRGGDRVHDERAIPSRCTLSAIAAMIGADASMPVLAASTPMSLATDSICSATACGGSS